MADSVLELGSWRIRYDADLNREIFNRIAVGAPEQCGCAGCDKFIAIRDSFYPTNLRDVLATLGIDYRKETEVVTYGEDGKQPLGGWYNFAGVIDAGEDDVQYLDGDFKLEIAHGGLLAPPEFGSASVVKLEWLWPVKYLKLP